MVIFWCPAGVCKQPSFILPVTLQPLGTHQATIYHMKGDIHRFNMRYSSMPCPKRLLSYSISHLISQIALVHKVRYSSAQEVVTSALGIIHGAWSRRTQTSGFEISVIMLNRGVCKLYIYLMCMWPSCTPTIFRIAMELSDDSS